MGGDGRTTLCATVSGALARRGKRTIAVDAHIVNGHLDEVVGLDNRGASGLIEAVEEARDLSEACIPHSSLFLLQFVSIVGHVQKMAAKEDMTPDPEIMRRAWDDLRSRCDFVVIDSPPGYSGGLVTAAIAAADEFIVVVMPWWHSVLAAKRLIEAVKLRGKRNMRLVINRMPPAKDRHRDMPNVNEILENLQLQLLGIIGEDKLVPFMGSRGVLANVSGRFYGGWSTGQEYDNVVCRLLG